MKWVPGSNTDPETNYPDRGIHGFPHSFHANAGLVNHTGAGQLPSTLIIHLSFYLLTLYRLSY
jgi:hypothetical protein